jgi:hypothetical protein
MKILVNYLLVAMRLALLACLVLPFFFGSFAEHVFSYDFIFLLLCLLIGYFTYCILAIINRPV